VVVNTKKLRQTSEAKAKTGRLDALGKEQKLSSRGRRGSSDQPLKWSWRDDSRTLDSTLSLGLLCPESAGELVRDG